MTKQSKTDNGVLYRPTVRLWMMNASSASMLLAASSPSKVDNSVGWILDTDLPIVDERNMRDAQLGKDENICLMLELRNEEDGSWPRAKPSVSTSQKEVKSEERQGEEKETVQLGDGVVGMYNMG
jgi:predicted RND superfamily exporter protein